LQKADWYNLVRKRVQPSSSLYRISNSFYSRVNGSPVAPIRLFTGDDPNILPFFYTSKSTDDISESLFNFAARDTGFGISEDQPFKGFSLSFLTSFTDFYH